MDDLSETFRRKTILVTGGGGSIGTNLVNALEEFEVKRIVLFDNLSSASEWNIPRGPKIQFLRGDVTKAGDLREPFKERPPTGNTLPAHSPNKNPATHPSPIPRSMAFEL